MRAVTVVPLKPGSVDLTDRPEPPEADGPVLVRTRLVGVCGTDIEIIDGDYGGPPPGEDLLVIGHESLGEVLRAPRGRASREGDLVVGIVRRPDPVPCANCAAGEWDMCRNGRYTEWGIKAHDGYARERYRIPVEFAVKVEAGLGDLGVLLEPTSVVAKAWDQIARIGRRAVVAAGDRPGDRRRADRAPGRVARASARARGPRPRPGHRRPQADAGRRPRRHLPPRHGRRGGDRRGCGDRMHRRRPARPRCHGAHGCQRHRVPHRLVVGRSLAVDRSRSESAGWMVLSNDVVFGSVDTNRRHYEAGARALAAADRSWLDRLVSREVQLDHWRDAYARQPDDVKTVLRFAR